MKQARAAKLGRWAGILLCLLPLAGGCSRPGAPAFTLVDAAAELTNAWRIARLDAPTSRLLSSYDRKGGNDDYGNFLRQGPKGWVVLADLKGPGYVSRFWTTGEGDGKHPVRFFFDGEKTPRIETTLDALCAVNGPSLSPLAAYEPWCWYTFVPMPYRKRLVIMTRDAAENSAAKLKLYYQINFSSLDGARVVESYPATLSPARKQELETVRAALARRRSDAGDAPGAEVITNRASAGAGAPALLLSVSGPAVLRRLVVRPDFSAVASPGERDALMRSLVLRITWNDSREPSVEAPFGDFFGSVWRARQYDTFYFGMTNDVFWSRFPMPFERAARIEVRNDSRFTVPLAAECAVQRLPAWTNAWGYFHAAWRKSGPMDVGRPHAILRALGRGKYAGCILTATSLDRSWWLLEGDESIRVDAETSPGWLGTGLEDYFNAGWYYGSAIIRPFHGLPLKAHFRTIQYRIHQSDPVCFNQSADVQIERGPDQASHGWMESVAFYYLAAPGRADSQIGDAKWRRPPDDPLAPATVMTELNDLERLGDDAGATRYIDSFLEGHPGFPYEEVLRLRQLSYRAGDRGFESVRAACEAMAASTTNAAVKRQAEDLLWYESDPSNALLVAYCNTRTAVFLDGRHVGEAGDPQRMQVFRVTVGPGPHVLALKAAYREYPQWVQATLRTHGGDICTSPEWKSAVDPQGDWASPAYDDADWPLLGGPQYGKGPPEEPFIWLEPHAFAGMQSKAKGIWLTTPKAEPPKPAVFRIRFATGETRVQGVRVQEG